MLKSFSKFLKYLEEWESYQTSSFWFCGICVFFTIKSFAFGALSSASEVPSQYQEVMVQLRTRAGSLYSLKDGFRSSSSIRKVFPDWSQIIAYQEKQAKFYKSAMRKKREIRRLRIIDDFSLYSEKKLSAINYFEGKSFYERY